MQIVITLIFIAAIIYSVWFLSTNKKTTVKNAVSAAEKNVSGILFYQRLNEDDKKRFLKEVNSFLQRIIITAINTSIADIDKIYVAISAVIPMFAFKGWEYPHLEEVLIFLFDFFFCFVTD